MLKYHISPTDHLCGTVKISGSKNSALPIIAASMLSEGSCTLYGVPDLSDVRHLCDLIRYCGGNAERNLDDSLSISLTKLKHSSPSYELVSTFRASFLLMAPILARFGKVRMPLPGGCQIGLRPIDLHLKGFAAMGAKIRQGHGYVEAKCERLRGAKIYLDFPSVGATENILIAAASAEGETIIENAATEPEIVDLANFLNRMGADIKCAGCDTIHITGVKELSPCSHTIIPDRIEAGTFMTAAAICKGDVTIENVVPDHLKPVISKFEEMGIQVIPGESSLRIQTKDRYCATDIKTMPFPGFPTDMQSLFMSMMCLAEGTGMIIETVFENRFLQVPELIRMGAKIKIDGRTAVIDGAKKLTGAQVKATDLRAGAALTLAGLCAQGETEIQNIEHIERGYDKFEEKLRGLGAKIEKIETM